MTRGNIYALEYAWFSLLNSDGIATGQLDPDSLPAAPATSSAFLMRGPMTLSPAAPTYRRATFIGGGKLEGKADMGLEDVGDAELTLSQFDPALNAMIAGGLVDTTSLGGATISAPNHLNPSSRVGVLCAIGRLQKRATVGNIFFHLIYPSCQLRVNSPSLTQEGGTNPAPITVTITPAVGTKFPIGVAFGANQNWQDYSEFEYYLEATNPYFLTSWLQDGTAVSFTLPYKPVSSVVTGGNTDNWVARNGTPTAPSSINTSSGLVTMAAAGTASQWTSVLFPTRFVPSS